MKVVIIVFSPSGHTLKAAEMLKKSLVDKKAQVQLLDITRDKKIFRENGMAQYLKETVKPHDVICVGGPIYAGHFESNAMNIIKALPYPDKTWGKLAVPFATYGGYHSSIALMEAGALFHKSKRKNILGMKIAGFHTLSTTLPFKLNENKPGDEVIPVIKELVKRMINTVNKDFDDIKDIRKSFSYAFFIERIILKLLNQRYWHGKYAVEVDYDVCTGCGTCAERCPVNLIEMVDDKPQRTNTTAHCILCAECFHNCPVDAISFEYLSKAKSRLERYKEESPQSAVYPM